MGSDSEKTSGRAPCRQGKDLGTPQAYLTSNAVDNYFEAAVAGVELDEPELLSLVPPDLSDELLDDELLSLLFSELFSEPLSELPLSEPFSDEDDEEELLLLVLLAASRLSLR